MNYFLNFLKLKKHAKVQAEIINIDTAELKRRLEQDPNLTLIDVRNPNEINQFGGTI